MKRLTDNISSRYFEAADKLLPSKRRGRIVAFVESYDDVSFWRLLLEVQTNWAYECALGMECVRIQGTY